MPENPGREGGVPSTAKRASPKLPINEPVKRSYPQNSIPNANPFRLEQMNFRIKICQGCKWPLQSPSGTVTDTQFDFCVAAERSGGPTKTLKRDNCARPMGNRMHFIIFGFRAFNQLSRHLCHVRWSFPADCPSQSATKTSSSSEFIKSPASGSSDLIYNNWKSNKTTYKSYNNIMMKRRLFMHNLLLSWWRSAAPVCYDITSSPLLFSIPNF